MLCFTTLFRVTINCPVSKSCGSYISSTVHQVVSTTQFKICTVSLQWHQMEAMASQITGNSTVPLWNRLLRQLTKKNLKPTFGLWIHRSPVYFPHKGLKFQKRFKYDCVIMVIVIETCIDIMSLQWRHNVRDGVSNDQPHHCLLNSLFGRRSQKTSKFRVTGLCTGNSPGTGEFPARMASNADDVIMCHEHKKGRAGCSHNWFLGLYS